LNQPRLQNWSIIQISIGFLRKCSAISFSSRCRLGAATSLALSRACTKLKLVVVELLTKPVASFYSQVEAQVKLLKDFKAWSIDSVSRYLDGAKLYSYVVFYFKILSNDRPLSLLIIIVLSTVTFPVLAWSRSRAFEPPSPGLCVHHVYVSSIVWVLRLVSCSVISPFRKVVKTKRSVTRRFRQNFGQRGPKSSPKVIKSSPKGEISPNLICLDKKWGLEDSANVETLPEIQTEEAAGCPLDLLARWHRVTRD